MTSSLWLAIGAVFASVAGSRLGPATMALIASAVGIGLAGRRVSSEPGFRSNRDARFRSVVATAIGVVAVGLRLLSAGPAVSALGESVPTGQLPDGRGPWHGVIVSVAAPRDGHQVATVRLDLRPGAPGSSTTTVVDVAATLPRYPAVEPGALVKVDGTIEPPPAGPYADYLARIGVAGMLQSRNLDILGSSDDPATRLEQLRRGAGDALARAIPEPEAGLAAGILIGLRDRVDRDLAADFTTVGASHIVAISGWNISIVAATVAGLAGRLGRRRRTVLLSVAIIGYVLFAGASPSVIRAAAMAGVVLIARETGRAGRAAAALGWAVAILLVADPTLVIDAGFQLSTLATGGILAWANPLTAWLAGMRGGRVPGWLAESLGVSLAAQAATLPIVLLTFGRLALISPAVNLIVVPLVAPAMAASLLALAGGSLAVFGGPTLIATFAGLPAWGLLTAICTVIRSAAQVPLANVTLQPPWTAIAALVAATSIVAGPTAWRRRREIGRAIAARVRVPRHPATRSSIGPARTACGGAAVSPRSGRPFGRWTRAAIVAVVVAALGLGLSLAHRADGTTRITVLDVGQGDSILVEGGNGGRMLVDGGPDPDRLLVELDRRLPPWDRRIDILVLTHPHEDHVAGLPLLLDRYRVGRIFETGMRGPGPGYAAFDRELRGRSAVTRELLATGTRITLDDIKFRVLWPDPGRVPREPPDAGRGINDVSIVLLGEVAGRRFLLTGDVEDDVDPLLAARGLPHIDILKVAHHGSATASTPAFLDSVQPRVAIVSAGAGNPYGHPARSTIDRLAATGARVLRTDTDGTVSVTIAADGQIRVATSGARRTAVANVVGPELALVTGGPGWGAAGPQPATSEARLAVRASAFSCGIPSSG